MPIAEPLPTVDFNVRASNGRNGAARASACGSRTPTTRSNTSWTTGRRAYDFDKKAGAKSAPNTSAEVPPGIDGYDNTDSFKNNDGQTRTKVRMHYVTQQAPTTTPVPS